MLDTTIRNYLLQGKPGLSMLEDAKEYAMKVLGTKNLSTHPDFLFVEKQEKKKTLTVTEAELAISKASLSPILSEKMVIIIDGIDTMTIEGQNKLLKSLEDSTHVCFLLISYGGNVLLTVQSRCYIKSYKPLGISEFQKAIDIKDVFCEYYSCSGAPGLLEERAFLTKVYHEIWSAFEKDVPANLLDAMNLVKEKDSNVITNTPYVFETLIFLNACLVRKSALCMIDKANKKAILSYIEMADLVSKQIELASGRGYSKDNFFLLIAEIVTKYSALLAERK